MTNEKEECSTKEDSLRIPYKEVKIFSDRIAGISNRTWNPVTGCLYGCTYCFARHYVKKFAEENGVDDSFTPRLIEKELYSVEFKPGETIFVTDLGDLFGYWVPREWIENVLRVIKDNPDTTFILHTKNPSRFREFDYSSLPNIYIGTTIETNRDYSLTKAPEPYLRFKAMCNLPGRKEVSICPIMDFDLDILVSWIEKIEPEVVEVGADNHGNNLPEPTWEKIESLLDALRDFCPKVVEKKGLASLRERSFAVSDPCYTSKYYLQFDNFSKDYFLSKK
jgi:DNA repair photolyase